MDHLTGDFAEFNIAERDDFGRVIKRQTSTTFATQAPPEIKENARIIAVCGTPNEYSNPNDDGWFLSDFYLFKHLFRGLGSAQTWVTAVSPQEIVSQHNELLHGNAFGDRKVVLDEETLSQIGLVELVSEPNLKRAFLYFLEREARLAQHSSQPLLICIFGHGNIEDDHGIILGDYTKPGRILRTKELGANIPSNLEVSLFSNACYSGGWSFSPNLNITSFVAAGPNVEAESWPISHSLSRACGSIWASMIVRALEEEVERPAEEAYIKQQPLPAEARQKSFAAFAEACYAILLNKTDRLGQSHKICFSAQDDEWNRSWTGRSGIPLGAFQKRFAALRVRASTQKWDPTNRDPTALGAQLDSEEQRAWLASSASEDVDLVAQGLRGQFGGAGGGPGAARSHVLAECERYLASNPGRHSLGGNTSLHGQIRRLRKQQEQNQIDLPLMSRVLRAVAYRISATTTATNLLEAVKVGLPEGKKCSEWDPDTLDSLTLKGTASQIFDKAGEMIRAASIFPSPTGTTQGLPFGKLHKYVQLALLKWVETGGKNVSQLQEKVDEMKAVVTSMVEEKAAELRCIEPVRSRKRNWAAAIGKRWLSPDKGRSRYPKASASPTEFGSPPSFGRPGERPASPIREPIKKARRASPSDEHSPTDKGKR